MLKYILPLIFMSSCFGPMPDELSNQEHNLGYGWNDDSDSDSDSDKNNKKKKYVCHKGHTIHISKHAAKHHLENHEDDYVGKCDKNDEEPALSEELSSTEDAGGGNDCGSEGSYEESTTNNDDDFEGTNESYGGDDESPSNNDDSDAGSSDDKLSDGSAHGDDSNSEDATATTLTGSGCTVTNQGHRTIGFTFMFFVLGFIIITTGRATKLGIILMVLSVAGVAYGKPIDVNYFKPTPFAGGSFTTDTAVSQGKDTLSAKLYFNHAKNMLLLKNNSGKTLSHVVSEQNTWDLLVGYGFTDKLDMGLAVPFVGGQSGEGFGNLSTSYEGVGDVRWHTRYGVLEDKLGWGAGSELILPTSSNDFGTPGWVFTPKLIGHLILEDWGVAANLGYRFARENKVANLDVDNELHLKAGAWYNLTNDLQAVADLYSASDADDPYGKGNNNPMELDAGLRWAANSSWTLAAGAGVGVKESYGVPEYRVVFGVEFRDYTAQPKPVVIVKEKECPPPKKAYIKGNKIIITDRCYFHFDKTTLKRYSYPVLNDVVALLKENPGITKVRVEGHTDSRGPSKYNMRLSNGRAKAVVDYMVKKGIDPKRLTYKGYGEEKLLVKPELDEGDWQMNRRVEFIILEKK